MVKDIFIQMVKDIFIILGWLVLFAILATLAIGLVSAIIEQYGKFKYVTASGESGFADFCTVSYGQARCRTSDDKTIMVTTFEKIKELNE